MRIRTIKPDIFTDEKTGELSGDEFKAFIGLLCVADREGRMEDKPKSLRVKIMPYKECDFDGILSRLNDVGLIIRYEIKSERFIQVKNFKKHQRPNNKEPASTISERLEISQGTLEISKAVQGEIEIEIEIEGKGNITPPTPPEGVVVAAKIIAAENSVEQKTSSCARQELSMSEEYQSVLEAWKDCTAATGQALIKDENTRAGAELLADMLHRGDCTLEQIKTAMANARGDPETRRKYGLRGIARNLGNLQEARNGAATGRRGAVP